MPGWSSPHRLGERARGTGLPLGRATQPTPCSTSFNCNGARSRTPRSVARRRSPWRSDPQPEPGGGLGHPLETATTGSTSTDDQRPGRRLEIARGPWPTPTPTTTSASATAVPSRTTRTPPGRWSTPSAWATHSATASSGPTPAAAGTAWTAQGRRLPLVQRRGGRQHRRGLQGGDLGRRLRDRRVQRRELGTAARTPRPTGAFLPR